MSHWPQQTGRISISLPKQLIRRLDAMVAGRGFESRSQAIGEMIQRSLANYDQVLGDQVMAGTLTLIYDHTTPALPSRLAELQQDFINEVISSLHVQLEKPQTMEVILVQGPARKLQVIADSMLTLRGVIAGNLQLTSAVLPPLHPRRGLKNFHEQKAIKQ